MEGNTTRNDDPATSRRATRGSDHESTGSVPRSVKRKNIVDVIIDETVELAILGIIFWLNWRGFRNDRRHRTDSQQTPEAAEIFTDELLLTIVARLPFPEVLKVRELSRRLKENFHRIEIQACRNINFSLQFPCFYDELNHQVQGFDPLQGGERRIYGVTSNRAAPPRKPAVASFKATPPLKATRHSLKATGFGPLMVLIESDTEKSVAHVTNIVTRQRRTLNCPVEQFQTRLEEFDPVPILVPYQSQGYELIIWFRMDHVVVDKNMHFMMYNSESATWITHSTLLKCSEGACTVAYLDGKMYILDRYTYLKARFVRFNIRTGSHIEGVLPNLLNHFYNYRTGFRYLVRCGSKLMIVMIEFDNKISVIRVLKLESGMVREVSRLRSFRPTYDARVIASSNTIYIFFPIQINKNTCNLITYKLDDKIWMFHAVHKKFYWQGANLFSFEPGLNPFM